MGPGNGQPCPCRHLQNLNSGEFGRGSRSEKAPVRFPCECTASALALEHKTEHHNERRTHDRRRPFDRACSEPGAYFRLTVLDKVWEDGISSR